MTKPILKISLFSKFSFLIVCLSFRRYNTTRASQWHTHYEKGTGARPPKSTRPEDRTKRNCNVRVQNQVRQNQKQNQRLQIMKEIPKNKWKIFKKWRKKGSPGGRSKPQTKWKIHGTWKCGSLKFQWSKWASGLAVQYKNIWWSINNTNI